VGGFGVSHSFDWIGWAPERERGMRNARQSLVLLALCSSQMAPDSKVPKVIHPSDVQEEPEGECGSCTARFCTVRLVLRLFGGEAEL